MTARLSPPALRRGDRIGVVSPSSPLAGLHPRRLSRGLAELRRLGFEPILARHAASTGLVSAGTVGERVDDLHDMFADSNVRGIICTAGGFTSNQLLDSIDYDVIRQNPKVFSGYSDITALHIALWTRCRLTTFVAPALLTEFAEPDGIHPYTGKWFEAIVTSPHAAGSIEASSEWTDERLEWDRDDVRPRRRQPNPGPWSLRDGTAEGYVVGGNASTLLALAGTRYWPDLEGALLFIEDDHTSSLALFCRALTQLRMLGAFEAVSGLLIGRFPAAAGIGDDDLGAIVRGETREWDFPISAGWDFGHTTPMFPLPIGVRARLTGGVSPTLSFLDPAVRPAPDQSEG